MAWVFLIAGFLFSWFELIFLGIVFFSAAVVFSIVTLPVEFNASSRAIQILADGGYLTPEEIPASRKVLNAAALTYVASALVAILELLRLLWMAGFLGGSDE